MPETSQIHPQSEPDYRLFQTRAEASIQPESIATWRLFCRHVDEWEEKKPEKRLLLEAAFRCFANPVNTADLAQFLSLARQVKSLCGVRIYQQLLEAPASDMQIYLAIMPILIDLNDAPNIPKLVRNTLPDLDKLRDALIEAQDQYLAEKYPPRDIDTALQAFASVEHSLFAPSLSSMIKMEQFKLDYQALTTCLPTLKALPQDVLKTRFREQGKRFRDNPTPQVRAQMTAIMIETIRRLYKIQPYDTQNLALWGLLDVSPGMKGRLAQIFTGEGKTTILAMMAAFMAGQGHFLDWDAPSEYLAKRDCKKYTPFFEALGLTIGHICYQEQQEAHFHPQILLGTNANFQFPLLRDGLSNIKIRKSYPLHSDTLQERTADVILIDEVDNMMLDGLGSARIGASADEDMSWIFPPILEFVTTRLQQNAISGETLIDLKQHIRKTTDRSLAAIEDADLEKWICSAQIAAFKKQKDRDYIIRPIRKLADGRLVDDIVIVDYENTGRASEGCHWQHGVHQMLQLLNGLLTTPTSGTIASISQVSFYNEYKLLFGVTGTIGEPSERAEIQSVYKVDSFDVPPHFPSQRVTLPARLFIDEADQWAGLMQLMAAERANGCPSLVLFRTIEESIRFSQYLSDKGMTNQLLNETQRESEDYIVARAGEPGVITIATNAGGRGLDAILTNDSKKSGGLCQIFAFYPDNRRGENQGYGRAGRQGQPGRCCMMLNRQDPFIVSLAKHQNERRDFELKFMRTLLFNELKSLDSPATIMDLLNQIRSATIEQASATRCHHANQESFYYSQLKKFFAKFAAVYEQLSEENNREQLRGFAAYKGSDCIHLDEHNKAWRPVFNAMQSSAPDPSRVTQQGIEAYIKFIRNKWSQFYTKLTDQSDCLDMAQLKIRARVLYAASGLEVYLTKPIDTAAGCLGYLWKKANASPASSSKLAELSLFTQAREKPPMPDHSHQQSGYKN